MSTPRISRTQVFVVVGAGAVAALVASLSPSTAQAAPCTADSDCPAYFTCEVVGTQPCACPAGQSCSAACQAADIRACRSPACGRDSDCPSGMVCYADVTNQCGPFASHERPDSDDVDGGERCMTRNAQSCVPRYVPPCTKAADCGDGFTCEATATAGSSTMRCQLAQHACKADSDCAKGFACAANPALAICAEQDAGATSGGDGCDALSARVCVPPYFGLDFAAGVRAQTTYVVARGGFPQLQRDRGGCSVMSAPGAASDAARMTWLGGAIALLLVQRKRTR